MDTSPSIPSGSQQPGPSKRPRAADDPVSRSFGRKLKRLEVDQPFQFIEPSLEEKESIRQRKVDKRQQFLYSENTGFSQLQTLSKKLLVDARTDLRESLVNPGYPGVFSHRPFAKDEVVGFLKGTLLRRKKIPPRWLPLFQPSQPDICNPAWLVWKQEGNRSILLRHDEMAAWTKIGVSGTGVQLGLDGNVGGNCLSYLQHSEDPNLRLLAVVDSECLSDNCRPERNLLLEPENVDKQSWLIAAIANQDISAGHELTFDNRPSSGPHGVSFSAGGKIAKQRPECLEISSCKVIKQPSGVTPQEGDETAYHESDIKALPDYIQQLVQKIRNDDPKAAEELRAAANHAASMGESELENQALEGFFLAYLARYRYSRRCLEKIVRVTCKTDLAGKPWKNEHEIYQYLRDKGLLISGDSEFRILPIPWLAQHPDDDFLQDYICFLYENNLLNDHLVGQFSRYRVKKPDCLIAPGAEPDVKWQNNDISKLLNHYGLLVDMDDNTIDEMIDLEKDHDDPVSHQRWLVLLAHLQENKPKVLCRYVERLLDQAESEQGENRDLLSIHYKFKNMKINLFVDNELRTPSVNWVCCFLGRHGNREQREKALKALRFQDRKYLGKLPGANNLKILNQKLSSPLVEKFAQIWPGYPEYLGRELIATLLKGEGDEPVDSKVTKYLRMVKEKKLIAGCENWTKGDLIDYWKESVRICQQPFVPSEPAEENFRTSKN